MKKKVIHTQYYFKSPMCVVGFIAGMSANANIKVNHIVYQFLNTIGQFVGFITIAHEHQHSP